LSSGFLHLPGLQTWQHLHQGKFPHLKPYNYPVDGGLKFRGKRVLGSHKTIRGFIAGFLAAIFCVYLEVFLYKQFTFIQIIVPIDYTTIQPVLLGALLGVGALLGDAVKSFFKRQANVPPGKSWVPFDQIDYIVGGVLLSFFYIQLTITQYALLFALFVFLHPVYNFMGYLLKLRKDPFG
jgi:CDP-2,3-bis-(O-geranylgeranyl)-sn-glycerol synthase